MDTSLIALARSPHFIPLVYDYCDMWCERCPVTSRCLLFATQIWTGKGEDSQPDEGLKATAIEFANAVIESCSPALKPIAKLDLALCDVSTAPREPAIGHPLEFLARHYAIQTGRYLSSLSALEDDELPGGSPIEVVAFYHFMIASKTYRALVSHFASEHVPELLPDALGSAKVVLLAIDRSLVAWRSIASEDGDARVGGLVEVLEALKTGVEMRFPEARAFVRPGLDNGSVGWG